MGWLDDPYNDPEDEEPTDAWEEQWRREDAERRAKTPRGKLALKLTELLNIPAEGADEVVTLIEALIDEKADDLYDRVKERGVYDPEW